MTAIRRTQRTQKCSMMLSKAAKDAEKQRWTRVLMSDDRDCAKQAPARLYRKVDPTQELAENNYYKLPIQQQVAGLVRRQRLLGRLCPARWQKPVPVAQSGRRLAQLHRNDVRPGRARSAVHRRQARRQVPAAAR